MLLSSRRGKYEINDSAPAHHLRRILLLHRHNLCGCGCRMARNAYTSSGRGDHCPACAERVMPKP